MSRDRKRRLPGRPQPWFRWVLGVIGGGVLAGFLLWIRGAADSVYQYVDTVDGVHLPPVDAIVCLAGGRGRIAAAGDLWYRYWSESQGQARPVLYFSGLGSQSTWKSIRSQLRLGVTEVISSDDVVLERESTNTEQNALWLLKYARERNWQKILLVTSRYHMKRAEFIFKKVIAQDRNDRGSLRPQGSEPPQAIQVETLSVYQEPFEPGEWLDSFHGVRVTMGEYLKWLYYTYFWKAGEKR